MTVQIDWRSFLADMLPGFELAAMDAHEGKGEPDEVRVEIVRVNPSAIIPDDRECHILSECIRQMCCYAALVDHFNADLTQPGLNVAMTFLDP